MKAKLLKFLKKTKLLNLKNKFKRPYVYNEQVIFTVGAICKYLKIDVPKKYQNISKRRVVKQNLLVNYKIKKILRIILKNKKIRALSIID